jgi:peptidoglycan/LPS O-acetylase OafA/YrhL
VGPIVQRVTGPAQQVLRRSSALDVVRGVAILAVVGVHSFQAAVEVSPGAGISDASRLFVLLSYLRFGVELFFVLSGWLIFSLYYGKAKSRSQDYWRRRLARIWPLWILFTALSLFALYFAWSSTPVEGRLETGSVLWFLGAFIVCIAFLGWTSAGLWNVPPGGWSIQVEMGHYGLFWLLRKASPRALLTSVLVGYLTFYLAESVQGSSASDLLRSAATGWIRLGLFGTWAFFVFGGLSYVLSRRLGGVQLGEIFSIPVRNWPTTLLVALVTLIGLRIPIPLGLTYEALPVVLLLLGASYVIAKFRHSSRLTQSLGRYSYFIYFAHFWLIALLVAVLADRIPRDMQPSNGAGVFMTFVLILLVSLGLSWLLAIPSGRYFETPLLRYARSGRTTSSVSGSRG